MTQGLVRSHLRIRHRQPRHVHFKRMVVREPCQAVTQDRLRSGDIEDGAAMSLGDFAVPGGLPDPAPAGVNGARSVPTSSLSGRGHLVCCRLWASLIGSASLVNTSVWLDDEASGSPDCADWYQFLRLRWIMGGLYVNRGFADATWRI